MGRIKRYYSALKRLHNSKGFGIHSPFAFYFVTSILRERLPYYCYETITDNRKQLLHSLKGITKHPKVISAKNAKLIFRVTNYYNPDHILQIGSNYGASAEVMLMVSSKSDITLYDPNPTEYKAALTVLNKYSNRIDVTDSISTAIAKYKQISSHPYILINSLGENDSDDLLQYIKSLKDVKTVIILRNISRNDRMKQFYNSCSNQLDYGMSFTNEKIAFIILNPKLQHQEFLLWF